MILKGDHELKNSSIYFISTLILKLSMHLIYAANKGLSFAHLFFVFTSKNLNINLETMLFKSKVFNI